ncbi:MAG TPA: peptidylprolyl isomerase [Anaerolineales bacterium]|nr:peptidylprolyl isomerase [Anaerolineales bacterium]
MAKQSSKPKLITKKHIARLERERRLVRLVRTVAFSMIAIVILLLTYGYLDLNYFQLRKPIAEVNGETITIAEWQERVQLQRLTLANEIEQYQLMQQTFGFDTSAQQQQLQFLLQSPDILGQQVLDQMIEDLLIRQEAKKRGITVTEEELEEYIQAAYQYFPHGTPTPTVTPTPFEYPTLTSQQLTLYPSTATPTTAPTSTPQPTATRDPSATPTATFTAAPPTPTFVPEAATPTPTPYTLEGFQTAYNNTIEDFKTFGISEATLRAAYEMRLLRQKVMEAVTADMPTTEEQVWARHILVKTESEAKAVIALLKQGVDFAKLAKQYSADSGSAAQGGDLGWFGRGEMVSEFENAAFTQPIGEIGEPVKSSFGYHIIQVLARQEIPLTASQLEQKRETTFSEWLTKAREEATIVTNDNWKQHIPPMPDFTAQAR